jgi:hypothetical protein
VSSDPSAASVGLAEEESDPSSDPEVAAAEASSSTVASTVGV